MKILLPARSATPLVTAFLPPYIHLFFNQSKAVLRLLGLFLVTVTSACTYMGTSTLPYNELAAQYTNEQSKYMDVDGLTIHYRDEGSGPPLLLLHGVASSLHTWDGWVKQLKGRYRIIRLDLPGFGLTGPDPAVEVYDAKYTVDKLNRFMQELGISKFFIAGNSLGGYYAWNFAAKYPEKLYKMVLIDAAGYPQDMPFWIGFASWPVVNWVTPYMMPQPIVGWTLESAYADESKITEPVAKRYFDLSMRKGNRRSYINQFKAIRDMHNDPHAADQVKQVITPTLLLWGDKDDWIPLDVMKQFHRDLADSQYVIYEGVGHMPMEELPVQSARDASNFFMSELSEVKVHPQEDSIKFYSGNQVKPANVAEEEKPQESQYSESDFQFD